MSLLPDAEIDDALADLPGWRRDGAALRTELGFGNFAEAFAMATRIALLAERRNHHPDLTVGWGRLGIALTSHDAGGITRRDVDMARAVAEWTRSKG